MNGRYTDVAKGEWTRREFLRGALGGGALAVSGSLLASCSGAGWHAETFVGRVGSYEADIGAAIRSGLRALRVDSAEIKGKRILIKPNLVEPRGGESHISTHPSVVRGFAEAMLRLGASRVLVAEGPGHCRDSQRVLEDSGLGQALAEDRIPFVDLNYDTGYDLPNKGRSSRLANLTFPETLLQADWIVSLAKMKTHHWSGVTLSMKNLFGVMPGIYYGWPKNVFHMEGITNCILDICATLKPHFAVVDGIVGMEGDGPIMGKPKHAGVLVMGRNLTAVDATAARIMGIDPGKVPYLSAASGWLGPVREFAILQRGETISSVRTDFDLVDTIHAQQGIRLL